MSSVLTIVLVVVLVWGAAWGLKEAIGLLQRRRHPEPVDPAIEPPIVLNESSRADVAGDLSVFRSIEEAQSHIEVYDIDDPSFHLFDSKGRTLGMVPPAHGGGVRLVAREEDPSHEEVLVEALRSHLERLQNPPSGLDRMTLSELLNAARS
ncbi:hypothetical protein [Parvibaculum sp. MBR-TMA-1.3b-4.2]